MKQGQLSRDDVMQAFRLNRVKQMKLERLTRYNMRLREELKHDRIKASNCALMVIDYMETHEDKLIPEIWGQSGDNQYKPQAHKSSATVPVRTPSEGANGCCIIT